MHKKSFNELFQKWLQMQVHMLVVLIHKEVQVHL
jgi:hypothetical protein